MKRTAMAIATCAVLLGATACTSAAADIVSPHLTGLASPQATSPGHTVVVMMENHSYDDIIGSSQAPYLNSLARSGISLADMHAVTHPSQPNYIALFSGGTQGITDDSCPHSFTAKNLGSQLRTAHLTFAGYSEDLPSTGSKVCSSGAYARKHSPWTDFSNLPGSVNQPFTAFPTNFSTLPSVSFVIPNLNDDMHDGTITQADTWTKQHLSAYATWAKTHNSLLIITWDEDDYSMQNQVPTIIVGAGITPKQSLTTAFTHYSTLRTIEDRYGLAHLGGAAGATPIPLH